MGLCGDKWYITQICRVCVFVPPFVQKILSVKSKHSAQIQFFFHFGVISLLQLCWSLWGVTGESAPSAAKLVFWEKIKIKKKYSISFERKWEKKLNNEKLIIVHVKCIIWGNYGSYRMLRGNLQKKKQYKFEDIIQIEVDPLPPTLFLTNLFLTKCWSCWPPSLP